MIQPTANEVQQIWRLEENMNGVEVSTRAGIRRIVAKASAWELGKYKLLEWGLVKAKKESTTTAWSYKMTRKQEISELLRCWVTIYTIKFYLF